MRVPRWWLVPALTLIADQLTKWWVIATFTPGQSRALIPSVVCLTYVQNTGAAFGLFKGMTVFLAILSCFVSVWILRELRSARAGSDDHQEAGRLLALALVLGGAVGNLIDRVWRGYVVDFIDLGWWPVFNVADSAITIGVALLLLPIAKLKVKN